MAQNPYDTRPEPRLCWFKTPSLVAQNPDNWKGIHMINDAREEASRVSEVDGTGSHSETHQGLRGRPCRVSQVDPNIHIRDMEQPVINITRPEGREKTGSEIFDLGVKRYMLPTCSPTCNPTSKVATHTRSGMRVCHHKVPLHNCRGIIQKRSCSGCMLMR